MIGLIIFLTRISLGLKKYEKFCFDNQKIKTDYYYFTDFGVIKHDSQYDLEVLSHVSYNYLLVSKDSIIHDGTKVDW